MASIIKAGDKNLAVQGVAFNFDDMAAKANEYLAGVRRQGDEIIKKAQQEAQSIRRQAEQQGRTEAQRSVETIVQRQLQDQLATLLPALKQAIGQIQEARLSFLRQWESQVIELAGAIAARLVRQALPEHPELPVPLIREAIELAAGSPRIIIHLHPDDHKTLASQAEMLLRELAPVAEAEVVASETITRGGCRVETDFGTIDQQIEKQLKRITEELTGDL